MGSSAFSRVSTPERRVVITGLGAVTPLGLNVRESWESAVAGRSGIAPITLFDGSRLSSRIAGEVKNFTAEPVVSKKDLKKMDRFIQFALVASEEALKDSGLEINEDSSARIGSYIGVGIGGLPAIEAQKEILMERGPDRISPFFIPATISNLASGQLSITKKIRGPNFAITSACASGANAIGEATRLIRHGYCDAVVAGGSESVVCELAMGGFAAMRALSQRNEDPARASRPFDRDRDGFVLAEGCGIVVLEDYEKAVQRGAKIYAEVCGYGSSSDGYHMSSPEPKGDGAFRAMQSALQDARVDAGKIDYVNAHGTSTPMGDQIEAQAIRRLLGSAADRVLVSSTKSMTGHTLGAAGAIESIICAMAIHSGIVPPTINLDNPGEGCDLDFVPHTARKKSLHYVLNNSFGFGGTNASLLFAKI